MSTEEESQAIEQVLSALYCRPIFNDFRKPVEVLYPDIVKDYFSLIKCPVDLGSMLVMTKNDELTIDELRRGLRLVSENCINFNGDLSIMKNISAHMDVFASDLFEEVLNQPFHNEKLFPMGGEDDTFQASKLKRRRERLLFLQSEDLNESELKKLLVILHDDLTPSAVSADDALRSLVQHSIDEVTKMLYEAEGENDEFFTKEYTALADITAPFVELCSEHNTSSETDTSKLPSVIPVDRTVLPRYESFVSTLDSSMGVLSVFVQERLMRGNSYSTRWIRPANTIVWTQAPKDGRGRAAWWPAFVLASNSKLFPMQPRMSAINIKRLELDIRRALHKLRPRSNGHNGATAAAAAAASSLATSSPLTIDGATPSSSAPHSPAAPPEKVLSAKALSALANAFTKDSELVCPEGYLLVEFFGSHDFGWVKADICSPFTVEQREGATPTHSLPVLSPAAQGRAVIYCAEGVIKQAIAAALYLADTIMHCGEAVEEDLDIPLPSQSELEDSLISTLDLKIDYHALLNGTQVNPYYDVNYKPVAAVAVANGSTSKSKRKSAGGGEENAKKKGTATTDSNNDFAADLLLASGQTTTSSSTSTIPTSSSQPTSSATNGHSEAASQQQVRNEAHESCIVKGVFKASKCDLPHARPAASLPLYHPNNFRHSSDATFVVYVEQEKNTFLEVVVERPNITNKAHYRENATARVKAAAYWMEQAKPLNFQHYTATRHNRATLAVANKNNGTTYASPALVYVTAENKTGSAAKKKTSSSVMSSPANSSANNTSNTPNNHTITTPGINGELKTEPHDASTPITTTINNTTTTATKANVTGEKRKYAFKSKATTDTSPSPQTTNNTKNDTKSQPNSSTQKKVPGERSYNNTHLTSRGTNCFLLNQPRSCSKYLKGMGTIHTRSVDTNNAVFHLEHKSLAKRKELLRVELSSIKKALHELQALAAARGDVAPSAPPVVVDKPGGDQGSDAVETESKQEVKKENKTASVPARIKLNKVVAGSHKSILSPVKPPAPAKVQPPAKTQLMRATPSASAVAAVVESATASIAAKNTVTAVVTMLGLKPSVIPATPLTIPPLEVPKPVYVPPPPIMYPPVAPKIGLIAAYQKQLKAGGPPVVITNEKMIRRPLTASSMLPL